MIALENTLAAVIEGLGLPTRWSVLSDIKKQHEALTRGARIDVGFQSLAGTSKALHGMLECEIDELIKHFEPFNGLYFETGQGSEFTNGADAGIDMVTLESRTYGLARFLKTTLPKWMIVNDVAGNNERLAFVFKKRKVKAGRLFAEIAIPEKDFPSHTVVVPYRVKKQQRVDVFYNLRFTPFDRNPFIGTFESGALNFTLVNVHLYFGSFKDSKKVAERAKYARRVLEVYMLGKWAGSRAKRATTYDRDRQLSRQQTMDGHRDHGLEQVSQHPGDRHAGHVLRRKPGQYGDRTRRTVQRLDHDRRVSP